MVYTGEWVYLARNKEKSGLGIGSVWSEDGDFWQEWDLYDVFHHAAGVALLLSEAPPKAQLLVEAVVLPLQTEANQGNGMPKYLATLKTGSIPQLYQLYAPTLNNSSKPQLQTWTLNQLQNCLKPNCWTWTYAFSMEWRVLLERQTTGQRLHPSVQQQQRQPQKSHFTFT